MYERDAWDEAGDAGNGILGGHMKHAKGKYLLDGNEIEVGDNGVKICIIMPTAAVGEVLWADGKISDRSVGKIENGMRMPTPRTLTPGWNPYVSFQAVRADEGNLGELVTFTSSSWGGVFAFQKTIGPYLLKQRRQFPLRVLETKARGDVNGNIDPVFKIVGWSDRNNFQELLPPPDSTPAIGFSPTSPEGYPEPIDGEIIHF